MENYTFRYYRKERNFNASNNYGSQIYYLHQSKESLLTPKALNNIFLQHRNFGQLIMNGFFFFENFTKHARGVALRPNNFQNF